MPINTTAAMAILRRLSNIPGCPKEAAPLKATADLLADRMSPDKRHADKLVAMVSEDCDFFPGPKSLISMIHAATPEGVKKPFGCSRCDYTGFVETTMTLFGRTAPASAPCDCRLHPAPDPDEWQPRVNDEGVVGPVAAQRALTRDWADDLVAELGGKGVKLPAVKESL